jgi:Flp pilus assembly protein TadG
VRVKPTLRARVRTGQRRKGQAVAELAILFPFIILLLAGLVDMGRTLHAYIVINNAAREGARYAMKDPDNLTVIRQYVQLEAEGNGLNIALSDITVSYPSGNQDPGSPVRVEVTYRIATFFGSVLGYTEIPMLSQVDMVIL